MTSVSDITEAREQCLTSMYAGSEEASHEEFMAHVLGACKQASIHFKNDSACFRVPRNLDSVAVVGQLLKGGFMACCKHGGFLRVGWWNDADSESEADPENIAKLEELCTCIDSAVNHMGLARKTIQMHPSVPKAAHALFSWTQ